MSTESPETPLTLSARQVLASPAVSAFLVSQFIITVGVMVQAATLGKHVFDITGNEVDIGWLGLAEFLPAAALVLVTGIIADHFNRKYVAIIGLTGEMLCSVALVLYARSDPTSTTPMFIIAVFFGASRAFMAPSIRSIAPMIAPAGGLPRVVAMYSATWTGAVIVGPAASGFLYSIDPSVAYGTSAVLIFVGILLLTGVAVPHDLARQKAAERPTIKHALEGLQFVRRTPILLAAISLDLFAVLFGGAIALLPVIAEEQLHVGDVAYGWLRAAGGIGAASMAIFLAMKPITRNIGKVLLAVVGLFGAGTIVLGTTHIYAVAFLAVAVVSAADMVSVFIRGSLVPLVTPDEKLGRVMAVENVFIGASNELGAFESGLVASAIGTPATVVGGGIATIAIVGVWWFGFPSLRDVDRFEDLELA